MGFTTGLLGGATLTYSILYISIYLHRANRSVQRTLLSQQAALLNSVIEPQPPAPEPPAYEVRKAGLTELFKDRWNNELEYVVRNLQETDWNKQREYYEEKISNAWNNLRKTETGQELETRLTENVMGTEKKVADTANASLGGRRLLEEK